MLDRIFPGMPRKIHRPLTISHQIAGKIGKVISFLLAATAVLALTVNAGFYDSFSSIRLGAVLLALLSLHVLIHPRIFFCREFMLYGWFVAYMLFALLWTKDDFLALNTILPALNFIVILSLFGSLVAFHNVQSVLAGFLGGALVGAIAYTGFTGFPFIYPVGLSYNAIAVFYLFGLFVTLLNSFFRHSKVLLLLVGLVFLSLILATTSIKVNLGILLGVLTALIVYFKYFRSVLTRNIIPLLVIIGLLSFGVASNAALLASIQRGVSRVVLGIQILQARESVSGYGGFEDRSRWFLQGVRGWMENPVFGHGVEAFRAGVGMTSHSTPVDLLYNSGLIGFVLFYSIFLSIFWRLAVAREKGAVPVHAMILGICVCYLFVTMSGTMHYNIFLAAFIAISVGLLRRLQQQRVPEDMVGVE